MAQVKSLLQLAERTIYRCVRTKVLMISLAKLRATTKRGKKIIAQGLRRSTLIWNTITRIRREENGERGRNGRQT